MTIEKIGKKWRISEQRDGVRYRVSVDHKPSNREASDLIHEKVMEAEPNICKKDSFEYSCNKYIEIKSNVLSPSTIRGYRTIIRSLSESFRKTPTASMTQELIQVEVNNYALDHSPKSTRNLHGFISAVLAVYRPRLNISTTLPQKRKFEPYTPSEDDIQRILTEVSGTKYEAAYRLGCYGMRRGEICAITAADLSGNMLRINKALVYTDDAEWIIKPFPKTTESERQIYIDDHLADLIRSQGYAYNENPERLSKHLKVVCRDLDIQEFRFHDLRAFYATLAHSSGIPDKYIMAHGGWSSANIMDRVYKRAFTDKQIEHDKNLGNFLGNLGKK